MFRTTRAHERLYWVVHEQYRVHTKSVMLYTCCRCIVAIHLLQVRRVITGYAYTSSYYSYELALAYY